MKKIDTFKFLKPKNASFCPGCPKKDLNLNKDFQFDIPMPPVQEEPERVAKVMSLKDINKKREQNSSKVKTLF